MRARLADCGRIIGASCCLLCAAPTFAAVNVADMSGIEAYQQNDVRCSGIIKSSTGENLVGASVVVKGTANSTMTNADGRFVLNNVTKGSTLRISVIGYKTQEVVWDGTPLSIVMKDNNQDLGEVVVVGYGTQKKANLTGAVAQVDGSVLENRPIANIGQGLQGVVPNLNVSVNGGAPGQSSSFNIRGTTSLNGGSPLVLVDNVQMDPNLVNPDDVASISVLKDAASAAIYGARAAYGVILITTKKGKKAEKPQVSFSAAGYWQSPAVRVTNVNSMDYLKMKDIAYQNSGNSGHYYKEAVYEYAEKYFNGEYQYTEFFDETGADPQKWEYCGNTDWFKELYHTSFSQMYNVNISGGSERTTYYASVGFNDVNGVLRTGVDDYKKFNANLNVSTDVTKWLNVSAKISHTYTKETHPLGGTTTMNSTAYSGLSAYSGQLKGDLSPLMPVRHSHTGRLYRSEGAAPINQEDIKTTGGYEYRDDGVHYFAGQGSYTNPVALQEQGGLGKYKQNDLWMTGALKITPFEGLVVNADYTFNFWNNGSNEHVQNFYDYKAVAGTEQFYPWTNPNSAVMSNSEDYYTAFNVFAEYTKSFNAVHNFKIMAGYNQEYKHTKSFYGGRKNLIDNTNPSISMATGDRALGYSESHWAVNGFFARVNYNYMQRYLLEFNGRYDGSSKFPKDDRYAFFPSLSAAWRISEESFFEPIKETVNDLKLRGSWGSLGNQAVGSNFPYLLSYGINTSYGYMLGGQLPVAVTAPGLVSSSFTWETVTQVNVGVDLTMFKNRLTASFDWYRRNTTDMLTSGQELPAVLGASVPVSNAADMKTLGWELSIAWQDHLDNGLTYWLKGVLSDYKSEITKFANETGSLSSYYVGRKIGEIWGYRSDGLFQSDEEAAKADQSALWGGSWKAGDVRFNDLNNDNVIDYGNNTLSDHGDLDIIGNSSPRYSYGITAGLEFHNFDFEMFWQGIGKRDFVPWGSTFWGFTDEWQTPLTTALDYWTPDNTNAYFPRPSFNNSGNRQTSDRYLQNAAYVRLKNITLGYTFPSQWMKKAGISRLRLYIQGENLLTFTPLIDAYDPETLDNLTYPIQKKVSVGLNLTF